METITFSTNPQIEKLPKIGPDSRASVRPFKQQRLFKQSPQLNGLTGPTYSLSGSAEQFKLPPPLALQPGVEHDPGRLESWPAHPLNPARLNKQTPQSPKNDKKSPNHTKDLASIVPKPKFLEQLEAYLVKELRLLGCPPCGPHELRLQAHREVFEYLIEDFKTYKPLLSAIKNEYELFVQWQQEVIKELEPLEAQLEAVREDCERKILSIREEEKQADASVQKENQTLKKTINDMKNQELAHQSQIQKLQAQVEELYEKHRYEADARKLLISDYNDLKFRQVEQKGEEGGAPEEREDPVLLKLKLTRAREDLRTANQRINSMLADYGDVVPRREFEMLETSYKTLETEVDTLKNDHGALMMEHSTLQSLHKDALTQNQELKEELSQLKRSATPRPDWSRCAGYLNTWEELSSGRSSDRKVDVLLASIAGVDVSEITREDTLKGQGMGENVPRYLRYDGVVKNRHLTRGEANALITGFWHYRLTTQQEQPLDESLYEYLLSYNDNNELLAVEDGYNLEDCVSKLVHKPHIKLFGQIMHGELSERVFQDWLATQTMLTEALHNKQMEERLISEQMLSEELISILGPQSEDQLEALFVTAARLATAQPGVIDYIKLLSPDSEGGPSEFVVLLLELQRRASKVFVGEIMQAFDGKSEATLSDLENTIKNLDPLKPTEELHSILSQVYSLPVEQVNTLEAQELSLNTAALIEKLNYCGITKTGQ